MKKQNTACFTLTELLIVIAVIMMLASMLLPALNRVRLESHAIFCKGNLKQIGTITCMYYSENNDYVIPSVLSEGDNEISWITYLKRNCNFNSERIFQCPSFFEESHFYTPWGSSFKSSYIMNTIEHGEWNGAGISSDPAISSGWGNNSQNPVKIQQVKRPEEKIFILDVIRKPETYTSALGWNSDMTGITTYLETDHGPIPTTTAGKDFRDAGNHHNRRFNLITGDGHAEDILSSEPDQWVAVPGS